MYKYTDIIVSVPKKKEYKGKKYQAYIYSHTAGDSTFRVGLMSRLLLEINDKSSKRKMLKGSPKLRK